MTTVWLRVPLSARQIKAANWLHGRFREWQITDRALRDLAQEFRGFSPEATLIKVVAINSLYRTNVFAISRMATHVHSVMSRRRRVSTEPKLVEQLAALPAAAGQKKARRHLSFASKFAHFFIDSKKFPILDKYAEQMVCHHLGLASSHMADSGRRYECFVENFRRLKKYCGWQGSNRELDLYLWIAGQYRAWLRDRRTRINVELQKLFIRPPPDVRRRLRALLDGGKENNGSQ